MKTTFAAEVLCNCHTLILGACSPIHAVHRVQCRKCQKSKPESMTFKAYVPLCCLQVLTSGELMVLVLSVQSLKPLFHTQGPVPGVFMV